VCFDEIQLIKPGAQLAQARLRIRRADEREIVADYELFDDRGQAIARLSGARYQPARSRPAATLSQAGLVESWIPATGKLAGAAPALETEFSEEPPFAPQFELRAEAALIEGWASAAAAELARDLSVDGLLDIDELILSGRLPSENRAWAQTIFGALEASGLLTRSGSPFRWKGQELPPAEVVLTSFAWQHPDRAAEILLAASVGAALQAFGSGKGGLAGASDAAREAYDLRSAPAAAAAKALSERLDLVLDAEAGGRGRRILQVGYALSTTRVPDRVRSRCSAAGTGPPSIGAVSGNLVL